MADTLVSDIHARHSVRKYKADAVPKELLSKVLEHAQLAPSAMGKNPWRFFVCSGEMANKVSEVTKKERYGSPTVIFVCVPQGKGIPGMELFDSALATENLCIAAAHFGLGSVILAYNYPTPTIPEVKKLLNIPEADFLCPMGVAIGYPADTPVERKRTVDAVFINSL